MDMIVKRGGAWYAYEVKSSTRITPTYILDAALQYYVICHSGLDLADISIVNVNTDYERQGKLNYNELFKISSVRNEVMQKQDFVRDNLQRLLDIAGDPNQPSVQIGQQCFSPYACDFMGTCWKAIPENSVLNLNGVAKGELFQLYNNGIKTLDEIPLSYPLNKQLKLQVECGLSNNVHIDREGLGKFMDTIHYPLYFMDFETIMPAVPVFDKTHPYQHIPFQFSIHFKETKNAEPVHVDFLAEAGTDPRRQFVEELIRQTSVPGDILTYNATFERSILIQLKKQFPAYADAIDYIIYRIKDLMFPFENKLYYHPLMKGSYSIKNVLPALAGGIDYENLRIGSGSVAMTAFENLQSETDLYKIAETRDALKAYCQLDTLAMVKILDVLEHSLANNSGINKGGVTELVADDFEFDRDGQQFLEFFA